MLHMKYHKVTNEYFLNCAKEFVYLRLYTNYKP